MNAKTTNMVGRGSRITERVSRVYGVSGPGMYWAEKRAEPWIAVCYKNHRRNTQTALATRWARLGEHKGVAIVIGIKSESASPTPTVIREPRPTSILPRITFMSIPAIPAFTAFTAFLPGASPHQL
jgi:hypothetical protein